MTTEETFRYIQEQDGREATTPNRAPGKEIEWLRQAGLLQIALPGNELDFRNPNTPKQLQLLKATGRASLSVGRIYEGHLNALLLIHQYATPAQQERWFADAANGCLFGVWNTQAADGISFYSTGDDRYEMSGKKTFASGAGLVQRALVTGSIRTATGEGWQMAIVNMDKLSLSAIDHDSWQPMGMHSSISYTIDFSGYALQGDDFFGEPGQYFRQPYFSGGAIRFAAVQLGGAEAIFNSTVDYLKTLNRTGDTMQNARLADMTTQLATGNLWLQQSAAHFDQWRQQEAMFSRLVAFANMTRITIEKICLSVIEQSSKCIGARGLMQPFTIEKKVRDLLFYLRQPAPDAALLDVANYLLQSNTPVQNLWNEPDQTF